MLINISNVQRSTSSKPEPGGKINYFQNAVVVFGAGNVDEEIGWVVFTLRSPRVGRPPLSPSTCGFVFESFQAHQQPVSVCSSDCSTEGFPLSTK